MLGGGAIGFWDLLVLFPRKRAKCVRVDVIYRNVEEVRLKREMCFQRLLANGGNFNKVFDGKPAIGGIERIIFALQNLMCDNILLKCMAFL